jgi:mono/diheme cytochrome c family protein
MDNQPKYKAQERSTFFEDYTEEGRHGEPGEAFGRTMREPVAGSVAFGYKPFDASFEGVDFSERARFLKADEEVFEGRQTVLDADGNPVRNEDGSQRFVYLERMPIEKILGVAAADSTFPARFGEFMALGEKNFNIFCIVCHGGTGDGKGTVGARWSYPLPTWHAEQYMHGGEKGQDGYLFHTINYGVPNVGDNPPYPLKMPAYGSKLSEKEAWAIVAYIRALQRSANAPLNAVPERERLELERSRGASVSQGAGTTAQEGRS